MKYILLIAVIVLSGCAVVAERNADCTKITLRGWGAKSGTFDTCGSVNKQEPIRVPDVAPINK